MFPCMYFCIHLCYTMSSEVSIDSIKWFKIKMYGLWLHCGVIALLLSVQDSCKSLPLRILRNASTCFLWLCSFSSGFLVSNILSKFSHVVKFTYHQVCSDKKCLHPKKIYLFDWMKFNLRCSGVEPVLVLTCCRSFLI